MKIIDLIEDPVTSTWISDVTMQNNNTDITMALSNGHRYVIYNCGPDIYQQWIDADSKGQFFHQFIKSQFQVEKLI